PPLPRPAGPVLRPATVPVPAFVLAYRCGAVPDSHRVPSCLVHSCRGVPREPGERTTSTDHASPPRRETQASHRVTSVTTARSFGEHRVDIVAAARSRCRPAPGPEHHVVDVVGIRRAPGGAGAFLVHLDVPVR